MLLLINTWMNWWYLTNHNRSTEKSTIIFCNWICLIMIMQATSINVWASTLKNCFSHCDCYHIGSVATSLRYKEIRKHGCRPHKQNLNDAKNIDQGSSYIKSWAFSPQNQRRFYECNKQTTTWLLCSEV